MTHDVTVHVLGATVYDVLKFLVAAFILEGLQKWLNKTGLSKSVSGVVQLMIKLLLLAFFAYSALQSHGSRGFDNGVLFAVDCLLLLLLTVVVIYPFIRKFLPDGSKRLDWAKDLTLWTTYTCPGGSAEIISSSKGLHFRARFRNDIDRWAKMEVIFSEVQDYRGWASISFDIRCDRPYPESPIRLEVVIPNAPNGSNYRAGKPALISNGRATFLFQEMYRQEWSAENPCGYLDLQRVASIAVVCNTVCDDVEFFVNNFALVKFTEIPS